MKINKRRFFIIILGILLIAAYSFGIHYIVNKLRADYNENNDDNKHYVALISKSTESAFWKTAFAGANAASTEYNLTITMDGPGNEEDYEAQNEMIRQAVADGAEVIIFSAADYNANADAINEAAKKGVKIVIIDSDVNSDKVSCRISTDNYVAGRMAGEAILGSKEEVLNIGIINFDKNTANGQQREKGFRDRVLQDSRVGRLETINVVSTIADSQKGTEELLKQYPETNVIATFNEWTSLGVGYAVQELGIADRTTVVAFDSNVISVGMLETGEVDALIVQNPYAMGYLGVECAYHLIYDQPIEKSRVDTATTLITRENMFEEDCQKVLFSFNE